MLGAGISVSAGDGGIFMYTNARQASRLFPVILLLAGSASPPATPPAEKSPSSPSEPDVAALGRPGGSAGRPRTGQGRALVNKPDASGSYPPARRGPPAFPDMASLLWTRRRSGPPDAESDELRSGSPRRREPPDRGALSSRGANLFLADSSGVIPLDDAPRQEPGLLESPDAPGNSIWRGRTDGRP